MSYSNAFPTPEPTQIPPESSNTDDPRATTAEKSAHACTKPRCPEAEMRAAMTDAEFWEHVLPSLGEEDFDDPFEDLDERDFMPDRAGQPCEECGAVGACEWDLEGRALIHVIERGDDDD